MGIPKEILQDYGITGEHEPESPSPYAKSDGKPTILWSSDKDTKDTDDSEKAHSD